MFSGLIASISIKRKPCDLFLLIFQLDLESLLGFAHCKMRLTSLHDSYVRDICTFAVLCSVFRPFCCFTRVYEGHFMLCYKD